MNLTALLLAPLDHLQVIKNTRRVFIVGSSYTNLLDWVMRNSRYHFTNFTSGEECLVNLGNSPEVIVLDYTLPGMNGYDTLMEIKEHDRSIQVVILLDVHDHELGAELMKAGAEHCLVKDEYLTMEVAGKVEEIVRRQTARVPGTFKRIFYYLLLFLLITVVFYYSQ